MCLREWWIRLSPTGMLRGEVAGALIEALIREPNGNIRNRLASLAGRSDPAEAARIYGEAARLLLAALTSRRMTWNVAGWRGVWRPWQAG